MILKALKYSRNTGTPREWCISGKDQDFAYFDNINLLVGKNASGKSRTLNVIRDIANLLSGNFNLKHILFQTVSIEMILGDDSNTYKYILACKDKAVVEEILYLNNEELLNRKENKIKDKHGQLLEINKAIDEHELLVTQKIDDKIIYPEITDWGNSLRNYLFANQIEKNRWISDYTNLNDTDKEEASNIVLYTFNKGKEMFGETYISEVISCMETLNYFISSIDIEQTPKGYGLYIEEEGEYIVSQREMSQGMFRALSLFIMLCYARLTNISVCLLIDDMGEGLDFESSKKLIDIVVKKINKSNIQLFMSTNDRYVMNQIPLKYWTVIDREYCKSIFYDYRNSKEIFDDFKYTGLNNFDFLSTNFYRKGFGLIDEEND